MTRTQIVQESLHLLRSHFQTDDPTGSMTAARAGLLFKNRFPEGLAEGGFTKFSELLSELEKLGHLRTGNDSKNVLAIWLPEATPPSGPFRPLRDEVWTAFVARRPDGNRYMNRTSGELRLGLNTSPAFPEQWAQITQLAEEHQKQWAHDFLLDSNLAEDSDLSGSINLQPWYHYFGESLQNRDPHLVRRWKRWRGARVVDAVNDWCRTNDVNPDLVYEGRASQGTASPVAYTLDQHTHADALRAGVLSALAMMSLDELLEIPIPAKYWVQVFGSEPTRGQTKHSR